MEKKRKNTRGDNGQGTMRRKTRNCWEWSMMTGRNPETGKRTYKYLYAPTVYELREMRDEYLRDRKDGIQDHAYTYVRWAEKWLAHHTELRAPATRESYKYTIQLLSNSVIGTMYVKDIKTMDAERALRDIYASYSYSTYMKCRVALQKSLEYACQHDLVRKNVASKLEALGQKVSAEKEIFSRDEVSVLMERLPYTKMGLSIRAMLASGVRRQEVAGWDISKGHIAPDGSYVVVEQAVKLDGGVSFISDPKTPSSNRTIPIAHEYRRFLVALRNCCDGGLLWESSKKPGQPISLSTFDKLYRETLACVDGVRPLPSHRCRHTYLSLMEAAGVSPAVYSALAGHSRVEHTKPYLHIQDSAKLAAVEKCAAMVSLAAAI